MPVPTLDVLPRNPPIVPHTDIDTPKKYQKDLSLGFVISLNGASKKGHYHHMFTCVQATHAMRAEGVTFLFENIRLSRP